ncbi:hypothetical protein LTR37_005081 [Vermiconidia calcicola]|uniref:Uncharacterized protein n=1 Tax=Vermiconidia calcicola TaxID=1690605 RepID=A0ACC3NKC2_9PEZI|nr:hypothetical protein LTR37_005081 [Vermiconidia calcicola]
MPGTQPLRSATDLFIYHQQFGVVVCRACKFGVQPGALASHLLRHKIYRKERRQLLSELSSATLLDPPEVPIPGPESSPVEGLFIYDGYKCSVPDCEHLVVSLKRMKLHWREEHKSTELIADLASHVRLQTFFRGTKLRYFQVNNRDQSTSLQARSFSTGAPNPTPAACIVASTREAGGSSSASGPLPTVDLEALGYFHHFVGNIRVVLALNNLEAERFWQQDVVSAALQYPYLMHALLSLSASHVASTCNSIETRRLHQESAIAHERAGSAKVQEARGSLNAESHTALAAYAMIQSRLRYAHSFPDPALKPSQREVHRTESSAEYIQPLKQINSLRACWKPDVALSLLTTDEQSLSPEMRSLKTIMPRDELNVEVPSELLDRLDCLPNRMATVLGRPTNFKDVTASLSAIQSLMACLSPCPVPAKLQLKLHRLIDWAQDLSYRFVQMLERRDEASLIIYAYWLLLMKHFETYFWFLDGHTDRIIASLRFDIKHGSLIP